MPVVAPAPPRLDDPWRGSVFDEPSWGQRLWRLAEMVAGSPEAQAMGMAQPMAGAVSVPQVLDALQQGARAKNPWFMQRTIENLRNALQMPGRAAELTEQWRLVGGPEPVPVRFLDAGADAAVLNVNPEAKAGSVLKLYPWNRDVVTNRWTPPTDVMDAAKLAQQHPEVILPSMQTGEAGRLFWAEQPRVPIIRDPDVFDRATQELVKRARKAKIYLSGDVNVGHGNVGIGPLGPVVIDYGSVGSNVVPRQVDIIKEFMKRE